MTAPRFSHSADILAQFPELAALALTAARVSNNADVSGVTGPLIERATEQLERSTESEFEEIRAWRSAFSRMGLKPTQYRCAAESLLRRLRMDGDLPSIHPIIDICNAASVALGVPIAVFDLDNVEGNLTVCHADGSENYLAFSGETEHPASGEVIFRDDANNAHARRWTHRQSLTSAVQPDTTRVLIVSEAMHAHALTTLMELGELLAPAIGEIASITSGPMVFDLTTGFAIAEGQP